MNKNEQQSLSNIPLETEVTVTGSLRVRGAGDGRVNSATEVAGSWFVAEIFCDNGIVAAAVPARAAEMLVNAGFGPLSSSGTVTVKGIVSKQVPLDWSTGRAPRTWLVPIGRVFDGSGREPSKFVSVVPPDPRPASTPAFRWVRKPAAPAAVASVE